jgi:hypothetical protein
MKNKEEKREDANHKDGREEKKKKIVSSKHKIYIQTMRQNTIERKENNDKYIHTLQTTM